MKHRILSFLPQHSPWRNHVCFYDSIDSTNLEAKRLAIQGAPEGTVLVADHQTCGKGRMGRTFLSPAGMGIYLTAILRPQCSPDQLMHLTCSTAVAICNAIEASAGIRPGIKWTNDLVCGQRKLAGILTELSINSKTGLTDYAIVGIGLNCCQSEQDFDPSIRDFAGSLTMCTEKAIDRAQVAAHMIEALEEMASSLLSGKDAVMAQYRCDCVTLGKDISLLHPDGTLRYGRAIGIEDNGALTVCFSNGSVEGVQSGEVSIRGMYGYI